MEIFQPGTLQKSYKKVFDKTISKRVSWGGK